MTWRARAGDCRRQREAELAGDESERELVAGRVDVTMASGSGGLLFLAYPIQERSQRHHR